MERTKRVLKFFIGLPLTILSVIFIFKIIFDSRESILSSLSSINLLLFVAGVFFYALFFFIKAVVWTEILRIRGNGIPKRQAIYFHAISEIKRYVPLGIMSFVSRISTHTGLISKRDTIKSLGVEAILLTASAFFISLPALYYPIFRSNIIDFKYILLIILFLVIVLYFFTNKYLKTILKYFDSFLLMLLAWLTFSIGSFLIAISFTFINPDNFIFVLSYFVLSWLIGFLSFITPMGLGVREVAITAGLSLFVPIAFASTIAILTRVGMIIGEIFYVLFAKAFYNLHEKSKILKLDSYKIILTFFVILYSIYFINFTLLRHFTFSSGRFDLGNMSQTIWNTTRGNFLMLTNPDGIENISRFGIHTDFILLFFSPFYLIWPNPSVLLIIQTLVISMGAYFVYGISNVVLKNKKISLLLSLSYLFNFWLQEQNIFDFHAVSLATTFLFATFYYLMKKNYKLFSLFLILALLTKENVFLVSFIFGLYFILIEKRKRLGILISSASLILFLFLVQVFIPNSRGTAHFASTYYSYLGNSLPEIFLNLFFKPNILLMQIFNIETIQYLNKLFLPTGYLSLLSPSYLVFALPDLAINILSSNKNLRSEDYHYGANIIPFIYISAIFSIKKIIDLYGNKILKPLSYYIIFISIIAIYLYSPLPGMRYADTNPYKIKNHKEIRTYLSLIPDDASVSSSNNVAAHLSHRDKIYVFPRGSDIAEYIVLYNESKSTASQIDIVKYDLIFSSDNFYLFKKKN